MFSSIPATQSVQTVCCSATVTDKAGFTAPFHADPRRRRPLVY